jgi:DNA invertase Pin-like site-specific DNA recombinase
MNNDRHNGNSQKLAILYERLSREDGDKTESDSIANQRQLLEDFANKNGFRPCLHISDDGYSGTNWLRPGWQDLIARIEAGEVSLLLVKDSTRIGRDYIRVGAFREMLRENNVRLICVNENTDSDDGDDDFAPFKDIISEWHARDTSIKIKSTIRTNGEKGKRLTNAPIYGYRADPEDKTKWVLDAESSEVVRRIFQMTIEGTGPQTIAKKLAAEKVERPSYYQTVRGIVDKKYLGGEEVMYDWNTKTITDIIAKQEYMGHTVNFRTSKKSYKDRRRTKHAPEEWLIFENTTPESWTAKHGASRRSAAKQSAAQARNCKAKPTRSRASCSAMTAGAKCTTTGKRKPGRCITTSKSGNGIPAPPATHITARHIATTQAV